MDAAQGMPLTWAWALDVGVVADGDDGRRLLGRLLATLAGLQFGPEEGRFEVAFQGGWAGFPEVTGGSQALLDPAEASLLG